MFSKFVTFLCSVLWRFCAKRQTFSRCNPLSVRHTMFLLETAIYNHAGAEYLVQVNFRYHLYLAPEDLALTDAISFAYQ